MAVRIGVIGAGALGFHHTRILRDVPGAELVGFHDSNPERAEKVSSELGVKAYELEALLDAVQAVSVVVPTPFHHKVAAPAHLLNVLKEQLARHRLETPVLELRLCVSQVVPHEPGNASLLPEPGRARQEFVRLIERLNARLGEAQVSQLALHDEHRPEAAYRLLPYVVSRPASATPGAAPGAIQASPKVRPVWLLDSPRQLTMLGERPVHGTPLRVLTHAERIESGWWDGAAALRDYFIAADAQGALLWVYRERQTSLGQAAWYLHGLFG